MTAAATAQWSSAFEQLGRGDVDFAGGKGANLGELTAAGLPVPARLRRRRARLRGLLRGDRPARADRGAARRRRRRRHRGARSARPPRCGPMVETEPHARLARGRRSARPTRELGGDDAEAPVAVRSSATAEDTESASFAGHERDASSTCAAPTPCSTRSAAAGPRCSAPARSSTAPSAASARPRWTSPSSSSARSRRPAPA